ncbi:transposable element Tcb1 transposase [Trichonephila clavipes]|nr:transposable element Tcb1 transposase [Trichonephila clavipes]
MTAMAGSDVVQSGRPIFDDFFQHLWPYVGNNTANVVFQMVKHFLKQILLVDRERSGHDQEKHLLSEDRLFSFKQKKLNSSQILKQWTLTSNVSVCPRTVRGRLQEIGLRGCKTCPKALLTEFQRKRRLTWAREHSLWTIKDWEKVIFSDESQFCISGNQRSAYVRRRIHEEFSFQCLKPTVKYPTKVMVWGCMSSHGVGRLHIVSGTVKSMDYIEILQNKLLPTARNLFWESVMDISRR